MNNRFPFWLVINAYAILLDAISVVMACACSTLVYGDHIVLGILTGSLALWCAYGGIGIHNTYKRKLRLYNALLMMNKRQLRFSSFSRYTDVPCHRMVVRLVLYRLGRPFDYVRVKRKYYHYPWENVPSFETRLIVFNNGAVTKEI